MTSPAHEKSAREDQADSSDSLPAAQLVKSADHDEASSTVLPLEQPPVEKPPIDLSPTQTYFKADQNIPSAVDQLTIDPEPINSHSLWRNFFNAPNLTSMILHAWVLLALALWVTSSDEHGLLPPLTLSFAEKSPEPELLITQPLPIENITSPFELQGAPLVTEKSLDVRLTTGAQQANDPAPAAQRPVPAGTLLMPVGQAGGGLAGRSETAKAQLVHSRGGSPASEQAVTRGLRWLMAHQLNDGSWRLNHHLSPHCKGQCSHPGNVGSTTAATSLALLPFLGAGSTHLKGEYQDIVNRGLYYLTSRMMVTRHGGDLQEGTMYAQGLSALVLCEAYAMSGDENLGEYAQAAIDFIVHAQHKQGGWRYLPGQPGDTTSLGWQLMALKSAKRAGLNVSPAAFYGASHFLDTVQTDGGAGYGYQSPSRSETMSAIGLLARMYLGWPQDYGPLVNGASLLAKQGPSEESMYLNYYATQVMFHLEGSQWDTWNTQMRDYLIKTQATEGHESGSWHFEDPATKSAGRLYHTAMSVMILEVYYRYLPLYSAEIIEGEGIFPID